MLHVLLEVGTAAALITFLLACWTYGTRQGRKIGARLSENPQLGMLQGAILGILGLLLAFCFGGALHRFVESQRGLVDEANAVTTLFDRASLLDDDNRDQVRSVLREYIAKRLELFELSGLQSEHRQLSDLRRLLDRLWNNVRVGILSRPQYSEILADAYAAVSDELEVRNAKANRHTPIFVMFLLIACAAASIVSIGYGVELPDQTLRQPALTLIVLIAAALWATIDMDYSRTGLIQLDSGPLRRAAAFIAPQ